MSMNFYPSPSSPQALAAMGYETLGKGRAFRKTSEQDGRLVYVVRNLTSSKGKILGFIKRRPTHMMLDVFEKTGHQNRGREEYGLVNQRTCLVAFADDFKRVDVKKSRDGQKLWLKG